MNRVLRVGLIGCGRISSRHIEVVRAIPELQLVAVCDIQPERLARTAEATGATAFSDFHAMVRKGDLDIVSILTESGAHAAIGAEVAPHVRALVVEKPLALTLEDVDHLIEQCDRHSTRLFVVKQNRFNAPVRRLYDALERGRFGKLVMGTSRVRWCRDQRYYDQDPWRGTWRWDGGVFTNQASHHLDLLQWMMGPVESVKAYTATRLANIETEDTGIALFRFTSGALGVLEATTATRPADLEGSLSILGELGSVVIGGFAVNRIDTWRFTAPVPEDESVQESSISPANIYGFGHYAFYRDVVDCIINQRRGMLDGLEGRKSIELLSAIYESANTGAEVRLRYVPRGVPLGH
jgi:UDP-N-acetyl-2-amino-2-deoxyglucuronate dehydrogenase